MLTSTISSRSYMLYAAKQDVRGGGEGEPSPDSDDDEEISEKRTLRDE